MSFTSSFVPGLYESPALYSAVVLFDDVDHPKNL